MSVCRNKYQENLFKKYAELGKGVARSANKNDAAATLDEDSWKAVSHEGIWRIAVPIEHGGLGGTWIDAIAALELSLIHI